MAGNADTPSRLHELGALIVQNMGAAHAPTKQRLQQNNSNVQICVTAARTCFGIAVLKCVLGRVRANVKHFADEAPSFQQFGNNHQCAAVGISALVPWVRYLGWV